MSVNKVSCSEFYRILDCKSKHPYVFVDFCADWCGPCRKIEPVIKELAEKYHKVTFLQVDIEHSPQLAEKYDITCLPTFILLKRGKYEPILPPVTGISMSKVKDLLKYSREEH